jgi:hypothetical protein
LNRSFRLRWCTTWHRSGKDALGCSVPLVPRGLCGLKDTEGIGDSKLLLGSQSFLIFMLCGSRGGDPGVVQ